MTTNIFKTLMACVACCGMTVAITSCESELELAPQGQITVDQLTDESIEGLLSSAYHGLEAHFFEDSWNPAFAGPSTNWIFDVRSDDAYKGGPDS